MIIHEPEIIIENEICTIKARIETKTKYNHFPKYLKYSFPDKFAKKLSGSINGFAASMVLPAMFYNEPLEIKGAISNKLAYGLHEYVNTFNLTYPNIFNKIDLKFDAFETPLKIDQKRFGAIAFSGGVDSTYSVWHLLHSDFHKSYSNLRYGVFIHGLDLDINDDIGFDHLSNKFQKFFSKLNLELIPVISNYEKFTSLRINWIYAHGNPLYAIPLLLSNLIDKFFIPSAYSYEHPILIGTSFLVDHLMSTEATEIIHHGAGYSMYNKIKAIKDWSPSHNQLRVCSNKKISSQYNCGKCHKCLRTMVNLKILDCYENFSTFKKPFSVLDIIKWGYMDYRSAVSKKSIIQNSIINKKYSIALLGVLAAILGWIHKLSRKTIVKIIPSGLFLKLKEKIYK